VISASYDNDATLFRNNAGVSGYPFTLGNVFSILGNDATPTTPVTDTAYYKNFYYYLYNIQLKSLGCASAARQAVTVDKPVITQQDTVLISSFQGGNQWYENDEPIDGATGQTYTPAHSGKYSVRVVLNSGCTVFSDVYNYAIVAKHPDGSEIGLAVFPVPATTKLNVAFNAPTDNNLTLSLVNNLGQTVYSQKQTVSSGNFSTILDVSQQNTGTYVLQVTLGSKVYGHKIIIVR